MKKEMLRFLAVASLVTSLAFFSGGCAKQAGTGDGMTAGGGGAQKADVGEGMGGVESLEGNGMTAGGTFLEGRTSAPMLPVYFDFDKSNIKGDQQDRIKKNGEFLVSNPGVSIRIEGNCDERGTNEYNMALGERRAMAAKKYLMNMGVAAGRLGTISYGEEKPVNYGHDELAWSQNRRDDFVVVK